MPNVLSPRMVRVIQELALAGAGSMSASRGLSDEIEQLATRDAACERLMSIPRIGPIISRAMISAGEEFSKGRDFAAWLGTRPTSRAAREVLPIYITTTE